MPGSPPAVQPAEHSDDGDIEMSEEEDGSVPEPGKVRCMLGGDVFLASDSTRLHRFLILGLNEEYMGPEDPSNSNADFVVGLIEADKGEWMLQQAVDISESQRASDNSPAVFCVAMCAAYPCTKLSADRRLALRKQTYDEAFPRICRLTQDLFEFVAFCDKVTPQTEILGELHRAAISKWYFSRSPVELGLEVTSYLEWNGYDHSKIIGFTGLQPPDGELKAAYEEVLLYAKAGLDAVLAHRQKMQLERKTTSSVASDPLPILRVVDKLKTTSDAEQAAEIITEHRLLLHSVPSSLLSNASVWRALIPHMPMTTLVGNLGRIGTFGLFTESTSLADMVTKALDKPEASRLHPLMLFSAYWHVTRDYEGTFLRENNSESELNKIAAVLEAKFFESFPTVPPTNKRFLLAVDVSAFGYSDIWNSNASMVDASAALCMAQLRAEPNHYVLPFHRRRKGIVLTTATSLKHALDNFQALSGKSDGKSLCKPLDWARTHDQKFDVIIIYTDNKTSDRHRLPHEAFIEYRKASGVADAKLIIVSVSANCCTIVDPDGTGMLDVTAFDRHTPDIINRFVRDQI